MDAMKRILLADTGEEFRMGLAACLNGETDMRVVGQTGDGAELLRMSRELKPDIIIGDSMAYDRQEEESYLDIAERIYAIENLPFASLHIDAPFCFEHEKEVLLKAGFSDVELLKEWTNTKLYVCKKG